MSVKTYLTKIIQQHLNVLRFVMLQYKADVKNRLSVILVKNRNGLQNIIQKSVL